VLLPDSSVHRKAFAASGRVEKSAYSKEIRFEYIRTDLDRLSEAERACAQPF
jgi:hypothetical protein